MKKKLNKHAKALSNLATIGRKKIPKAKRIAIAKHAVSIRELKRRAKKEANLTKEILT